MEDGAGSGSRRAGGLRPTDLTVLLLRGHASLILDRWSTVVGLDRGVAQTIVACIEAEAIGARSALEVADAFPSDRDAVHDLGALRTILHELAIEHLQRADAVATAVAVNDVLDRVLDAAREEERQRLELAGFTDPLTGAGNRRLLERDFPKLLATAQRQGVCLALAVIDLDKLKAVNDRDGHAAGDRALRSLATGLSDSRRGGDALYRIGGDEFVLLMPSTDDAGAAELLRRRASGLPSFTAGIASAPHDGADLAAVLEAADQRLLDAKAGRPTAMTPLPRRRTRAFAMVAALGLTAVAATTPLALRELTDNGLISRTLLVRSVSISILAITAIVASRAAGSVLRRTMTVAPVAFALMMTIAFASVPQVRVAEVVRRPAAAPAHSGADGSIDGEGAVEVASSPTVTAAGAGDAVALGALTDLNDPTAIRPLPDHVRVTAPVGRSTGGGARVEPEPEPTPAAPTPVGATPVEATPVATTTVEAEGVGCDCPGDAHRAERADEARGAAVQRHEAHAEARTERSDSRGPKSG